MTHALSSVHSTTYRQLLGDGQGCEGSATHEILYGCVCARCGTGDLTLAASWVLRWFWDLTGQWRLPVRLARCQACKARERILPFDALPGKQAGVEFVFTCVSEVRPLSSEPLVGVVRNLIKKGLRVSRQLLSKWVAGVRARGDDLFELLRHRAVLAPTDCVPTRRLVSFARTRIAARESGIVFDEVGSKDGFALVLETVRAFGDCASLALFGARGFRQKGPLVPMSTSDVRTCRCSPSRNLDRAARSDPAGHPRHVRMIL